MKPKPTTAENLAALSILLMFVDDNARGAPDEVRQALDKAMYILGSVILEHAEKTKKPVIPIVVPFTLDGQRVRN